jgi:hypothetical protein
MIGITLVLVLLIGIAAVELFYPKKIQEGFESMIPVINPKAGYFAQFVPRRGDIGPGEEQAGYIQDPRYFHGYADVQRLGIDHDFCRMVQEKGSDDKFFACALAGTENLSGIDFRTQSTSNGLRISRDDYMRDIEGKGRAAYCRILKGKNDNYEALCNRALDTDFDVELVVDVKPPPETEMLLRFYEGCVFWYRFRDDMLDYVNNTKLMTVGEIKIDETPNPPITEALKFNGIDQFLRIGDTQDLDLGYKVPLRSLRGIMLWVYFDEFTQNAHILDFGDGPGQNNIVLGIIGRGDATITDAAMIRPPLICGEDSTVPEAPSGPQPVPCMSPLKLAETTSANVDQFTCDGFEIDPRRLPPSRIKDKVVPGPKNKATLLYEVWDNQQRKMRIRVPSIIPLKKWTHITITAKNNDAFRPDIGIYVDGKQVFVEPSGFLPQASILSNCYVGKSNWLSATSQYENRDELFKGRIFDLRGYKVPLGEKVITESVGWGKEKLGLHK